MATWVAVFVAAIAGCIAYRAYREQVESKKLTLWRDLSKEFDHELKWARAASVGEFGKNTDMKYFGKKPYLEEIRDSAQPVLDFFETVAYLVRNDLIPLDLAKHTWRYHFSGYYKAAANYIAESRLNDPTIYGDITWLRAEWGPDPVIELGGLREFFEGENNALGPRRVL